MSDLRKLLVDELKDLYDAEHRIVKALPTMIEKTSDEDLRKALENHLEETEGQITRLESAFEHLSQKAQRKACKGIQGILEEGEEALEKAQATGAVKDALIIAGAQRVEHYEIAAYGTARTWAEELDLDEVASLLDETLDEESAADEKLTSIAEGGLVEKGVNERAAART